MTDREIDAPSGWDVSPLPCWRLKIFFVLASALPPVVIENLTQLQAADWLSSVRLGIAHEHLIDLGDRIIRHTEVAMAVVEDQRI